MELKHRQLLEIFIITYNRAIHLDNTLHQLVDCPFIRFPITILDNCSADNTQEVFLKYKDQFPNLAYIKNKHNIGADANVLRAAELSEGSYTWILCDDDEYDFTNCNDILEELQKGEADAIMVGAPQMCSWPMNVLYTTPANLIKRDFAYFVVPSFVPSAIFNTELFQSQIPVSYKNIVNLFPAMTYYIKLYNEDRLVYVAKHKIVNAGERGGAYASFLAVMSGLINTFYLIDLPSIRRKSLKDAYPNLSYKKLIDYALIMKHPTNTMSLHTIFRLIRLLNWKQKFIFLMAYIGSPVIKNLTYNYRTLYKIANI